MANNDFRLILVQSSKTNGFLRYISMAGSMETIATNGILLVILCRNRIVIGFLRKGHTESGIKHSHIFLTGNNLLTSLNAHKIRRIMQWSEVEAFPYHFLYLFVYNDTLREFITAVEHSMSDSGYLVYRLYHTMFAGQSIKNQFHRYGVIRHILFYDILFSSRYLMFHTRTRNSDTLTKSFCQYLLSIHIHELILQRRGSTIDY